MPKGNGGKTVVYEGTNKSGDSYRCYDNGGYTYKNSSGSSYYNTGKYLAALCLSSPVLILPLKLLLLIQETATDSTNLVQAEARSREDSPTPLITTTTRGLLTPSTRTD